MQNQQIAIIGSSGYMGRRIYDELKKTASEFSFVVSGTSSSIRKIAKLIKNDPTLKMIYFDFTNKDTFQNLKEYSIIINVSDTTKVNPLPFLTYLLNESEKFQKPALYVETSSYDKTSYDLINFSKENKSCFLKILLGVGVFPGISNVLAQSCFETINCEKNNTLDFVVKLSPFSSAGRGMTNLMAALISEFPTVIQDKNKKTLHGKDMFYKHKNISGVRVGLSDTPIHYMSFNLQNSSSIISLTPNVLNYALYILMRLSNVSFLRKLLLKISELSLYLLRGILFSKRKTNVTFIYRSEKQQKVFCINDAVSASAWFVLLMIKKILQEQNSEQKIFQSKEMILFSIHAVTFDDVINNSPFILIQDEVKFL